MYLWGHLHTLYTGQSQMKVNYQKLLFHFKKYVLINCVLFYKLLFSFNLMFLFVYKDSRLLFKFYILEILKL